jgi:hypothetical protein
MREYEVYEDAENSSALDEYLVSIRSIYRRIIRARTTAACRSRRRLLATVDDLVVR